jgi:ferredoxin
VKIPRLGREIDVPVNQTMLDVLESAGVDMIFDCRKGECGLCALPILEVEGIVDHRDGSLAMKKKLRTRSCAPACHG